MVLIKKFNCLGACGSSQKRAHTRYPRYEGLKVTPPTTDIMYYHTRADACGALTSPKPTMISAYAISNSPQNILKTFPQKNRLNKEDLVLIDGVQYGAVSICTCSGSPCFPCLDLGSLL